MRKLQTANWLVGARNIERYAKMACAKFQGLSAKPLRLQRQEPHPSCLRCRNCEDWMYNLSRL